MQKWGCGWDAGATGREMANLVSWSRAQESVTVQTLECRSCLNAELEHTKGVKGAGRRLGREGRGKADTGKGLERSTKGFMLPLGGRGVTLSGLPKTKTKNQNQNKNPKCHVKLREL